MFGRHSIFKKASLNYTDKDESENKNLENNSGLDNEITVDDKKELNFEKSFYPSKKETYSSGLSLEDKLLLVLKGCSLGDSCGLSLESSSPTECKNVLDEILLYDNSDFDVSDDTVLTVASCNAIIKQQTYESVYRKYGKKYPDCGFGQGFIAWLNGKCDLNSCGNGSAMRVSPCGCLENVEDVVHEAYLSAITTHKHPEGIKGAIAIAVCIWMIFHGYSKDDVEEYGKRIYPDSPYLTQKFPELFDFPKVYGNPCTCQITVPLAIACFVNSISYEDCILKAILLGWDTDTQAAIAGSLAMAYYKKCSSVGEHTWAEIKNRNKDLFIVE